MTGALLALALRGLDRALERAAYLIECARVGVWACWLWVRP